MAERRESQIVEEPPCANGAQEAKKISDFFIDAALGLIDGAHVCIVRHEVFPIFESQRPDWPMATVKRWRRGDAFKYGVSCCDPIVEKASI